MIVSGHNNSCWGTNVPGHKRVWAQIKCVWAQTCVGTNVCGHSRLGPIMYGHKRGGTDSLNSILSVPDTVNKNIVST